MSFSVRHDPRRHSVGGASFARDSAARAAKDKAAVCLQLSLNSLSDFMMSQPPSNIGKMRVVRMDSGDNKATAHIDPKTQQFYYHFEPSSGTGGYWAGPLSLRPPERNLKALERQVLKKLGEVNLSDTMLKTAPKDYQALPHLLLGSAGTVKQRAYFDAEKQQIYVHVTGPRTGTWKPYWSGPISFTPSSLPR